MNNFYAIIPAAGMGSRFGGKTKKQFLRLKGKSLLDWTLDCFLKTRIFQRIVVCLPVGELTLIRPPSVGASISYIEGGATRAESVYNGFCHLHLRDDDIVLVHDAVRPLLSSDLIRRVAKEAGEKGSTIPVIPVSDTIKEIKDGVVSKTIDRSRLAAAQTPQGFPAGVLKKVYKKLKLNDPQWTDEAMMVEAIGEKVHAVEGELRNIKVTTAEDLRMAEFYLRDE